MVTLKRCPICGRYPKVKVSDLKGIDDYIIIKCHPLFHPIHHEVRATIGWGSDIEDVFETWNADCEKIAEAISTVNTYQNNTEA